MTALQMPSAPSGVQLSWRFSGPPVQNLSQLLESQARLQRDKGAFYLRYSDSKAADSLYLSLGFRDLLIEQNNHLYPVESKKTATPSKNANKNFSVLQKLDKPIGDSAIICLREQDTLLAEKTAVIPVSYL